MRQRSKQIDRNEQPCFQRMLRWIYLISSIIRSNLRSNCSKSSCIRARPSILHRFTLAYLEEDMSLIDHRSLPSTPTPPPSCRKSYPVSDPTVFGRRLWGWARLACWYDRNADEMLVIHWSRYPRRHYAVSKFVRCPSSLYWSSRRSTCNRWYSLRHYDRWGHVVHVSPALFESRTELRSYDDLAESSVSNRAGGSQTVRQERPETQRPRFVEEDHREHCSDCWYPPARIDGLEQSSPKKYNQSRVSFNEAPKLRVWVLSVHRQSVNCLSRKARLGRSLIRIEISLYEASGFYTALSRIWLVLRSDGFLCILLAKQSIVTCGIVSDGF